jgi:hypothetical protein
MRRENRILGIASSQGREINMLVSTAPLSQSAFYFTIRAGFTPLHRFLLKTHTMSSMRKATSRVDEDKRRPGLGEALAAGQLHAEPFCFT